MAHIKYIRFDHVENKENGCECDNCGQWIKNIWTVTFQEGESLHFGIDCYNKRINGKLSKFGKREMNRILKHIKETYELLEELQQEETTEKVLNEWEKYKYWQTYWQDKTFEEWKTWMLSEVLPNRLENENKELERFKKINF